MEARAPDIPLTAAGERDKWTLVALCVIAGGLSVRLDSLGTALAATGAGLVGRLALSVWEWSRLPSFMRSREARDDEWPKLQPLLWLTLGLVLGLALLALIRLAIEPLLPEIGARIAAAGALPIWRRVLIIYVAAVIEEVIFRLLLMSAVVGLATRFSRRTTLVPTPGVVWMANTTAALAFAGVHLPSWSSDPLGNLGLTSSVLLLNLIVGLVMGYVFATRGIAAAMWTHVGGDCAFQFLGPLSDPL